MSVTGYKWISVVVAIMVLPSTLVSPAIFKRIGAAAACVLGNVLTAVVTMALLWIANVPATNTTFAAFVTVLCVGYPLTVVSQLSTGPMLDVLAPKEKRGYVQGINTSCMNFAGAVAPWLLGLLADAAGTNAAIWTGVGISFLAAIINTPLVFQKQLFGPEPKKPHPESRPLVGEDKELVEKALRGEWVPAEVLIALNQEREERGQPYIVAHVKTFEEDKASLALLDLDARTAFQWWQEDNDRLLREVTDPSRRDKLPEICAKLNTALHSDPSLKAEVHQELGRWFADYLNDSGYEAQVAPILIKQMILSAFPPINKDKEYTPENAEKVLLNARNVLSQYITLGDDRKYTLEALLGGGGARI